MKKTIKMAILFITFLFFNYDVQALQYVDSVLKAEKYMIEQYDYKNTYQRYIVEIKPEDALKFYDNTADTQEKFKYGGLISEQEFNITTKNINNSYSYLYESKDFWTLTNGENTGTKKVISKETKEINKDNDKPGLKITEYVNEDVSVSGTGKFDDPWIFVPQYQVVLRVNKEEYGQLKTSNGDLVNSLSIPMTLNSINYITIAPKAGYQYLGNTCGYIINDADIRNNTEGKANTLILHEVTRDFECTINFGEKPYKITIDNDTIDTNNNSSLSSIYILPEKSWYNDEQAQNQISVFKNLPKQPGYKTEGIYFDKIENNGKIKIDGTCHGIEYISATGELKKATERSKTTITADRSIYPCYRPYQYKVKYDCNGGTNAPAMTTHTYDVDPKLAENTCQREGYKFIRWNSEKNGSGASFETGIQEGKNIISNPTSGQIVTLYAEWEELIKYEATFKLNGAAGLSIQADKNNKIYCYTDDATKGCEITMPTITAANGFNALGFNTIANGTTAAVNQGQKITLKGNVTYYAITKSTSPIKVTFNANGAETVTESVSCYRYNGSSTCSIKSPNPTVKTGYTLIGYNTSATAKVSNWAANTSKDFSTNATYYVIQSKKISATFNKNGAESVSSATVSCTLYNKDETCKITSPTITAANGFNVVGWNTSANATTSTLAVDTEFSISNNITYNAITKKEIKATFNKNGASSIGTSSVSCYVYNGSTAGCSITSPTITAATGFNVVGWNTSSTGTTSSLDVNTSKNIKTNETYYAITKKTLKITFNKNGAASIGSSLVTCDVYNGSTTGCSITSPSITPASGFNIIGWNTSSTGTTSTWDANITKTVTTDATYNAITRKQITATFEKNGASSISLTSQSCYAYNGSTAGCSITSPSITAASGFTVVGWNTSSTGTTGDLKVNTQKVITANVKYYAITSKVITISFEKNGASSIGSQSQSCTVYNGSTAGCSITAPTITPVSGFEIIGWGTSSGAIKSGWKAGDPKTVTENATYYALTKKTLTATFVSNGSDSLEATSRTCTVYNGSTAGCTILMPNITASSGFTPLGWNTATSASTASTTQTASINVNTQKVITANTTFYAITKSTSAITITFTQNGAASVGTTSQSCYRFNGSSSCNIKAPAITAKSGFSVVGWNASPSGTTSDWAVGANKTVSSSQTYYAITKSTSAISVTFNQNGSSTATTTKTCYRYNGSTTCDITSPSITAASGFSVVGWNTSSTANTSIWDVNVTNSFSANATYYAITRSTNAITVTFNKNGASSIGQTSLVCYRYNGASSCNITSPTITAASGFSVLGWNTSASSTSSAWGVNSAKSFSANATYYAVTRKGITVSFDVNGASSITSTSQTCYVYNGSTAGCNITSPTITAKSGFSVLGWNTSSGATTNGWSQNTAKTFTAGATYYAITRKTVTVSFGVNGASSIGATSKTCYMYNGTTTGCSITSPTITAKSGFSVVGWNTSSGATTNGWSQNTAKTFTSGTTYYAITKSTSAISVTFNQNGSSTSTTTKTCYKYNGGSSCTIATPVVTAKSGYTANGWGTSSSTTSRSYTANTNYSFSANTNLYALQYKTIYVYFYANTASSVSPSSRNCTMYNTATTCSIQTGSITAGSGKTALGWSTNSSATSANYSVNTSYNFSATTYLYAITKSSSVTYTATFKSGKISFSTKTRQCTGSGSCSVTSPYFDGYYNNYGSEILRGSWSTSSSSYFGSYEAGDNITISSNPTYYATLSQDGYYYSSSDNGVNVRSSPGGTVIEGLNNGYTFRPTKWQYSSGTGCPNNMWLYGTCDQESWKGWLCSYYLY